jgi:hypothetical protein
VTTPRAGGVERATRAEVGRMGFSVQSDAAAALAVSLARQIDASKGAVAAAAAAAQLRLLLDDLRKAAAEKPAKDGIDELRARRARASG